jgi:hypothetical protein
MLRFLQKPAVSPELAERTSLRHPTPTSCMDLCSRGTGTVPKKGRSRAGRTGGQLEFRAADALIGWSYFTADEAPQTCRLWRRLGWDPALVWLRQGELTKWIFIPGDGSAEKPVALDIGG